MSMSTALRREARMKASGPISDSSGAAARFLPDLFKSMSTGLHRWHRYLAERRAMAKLERVSDRMLADMGIARSEIQRAVRYGRRTAD